MDTKPSLTVDVDQDTNNKKGPSTLSTKATESSVSPYNTPTVSATNVKTSFQTPVNQTRKDWETICISPTGLDTYDSAMERLQRDKMDKQDFYRNGTARLKACVQYVYGSETYKNLSPEVRVDQIFQLVKEKDRLGRLCSIVFSHPKDTLMVNPGQAEAYVHMALTIDLFCNHEKRGLKKKNAVVEGGFPNKPVMLCQKGRNCYHPTTVLFVSLYDQHFHNHSRILDAAQVARRYLFQHHGQLEKRVIENRGFSAATFAEDVTHSPAGPGHWKVVDCGYTSLRHLAGVLINDLRQLKVGLVSGFEVKEPFHAAAQMNAEYQKEKHLGYFLFDGDDPSNTEGEWVSYKSHEATLLLMSTAEKKRTRKNREDLRQMEREILKDLQDQYSKGTRRLEEMKKALRKELGTDGLNQFDGIEDLSSSPTSQSSGVHALVLLACEENIRTGKTIFLLFNPWTSMPLVGVSAAYLRACKARVHFLVTAPKIGETLSWNSETRIVDCVSCDVEGGDGTSPEGWMYDAFGLSFPEPDGTSPGGWMYEAFGLSFPEPTL